MSSPGQPRAVIFDLGKVLVDFDYSRCAAKLALRASRTPGEFQTLIDHSPLLFQYETGEINKARFHREICALTGYAGSLEEFAPAFADIFDPIEPMIAAQALLRKAGVPTFILSNTNDLAIAHIRKSFPFFSNFDGYVFSFEHGVMKPDERIYAIAEEMAGRPAEEILYIDDRAENIEPARRRGWRVIHHVSPNKTLDGLKKLGLLPG